MIVYADGDCEQRPAALLERIAALVRAARRTADAGARQERARSALLLAGQLEQGAYDHLPKLLGVPAARAQIALAQALTARIADALLAAWTVAEDPEWAALDPAGALAAAARAVHEARAIADLPLALRTPEGSAHYALYPEQYIESARAWAAAHASHSGAAAVVGIRSAGTALAAVVAAVLRASGRRVVAISCRPSGHPFARQARVEASELDGARFGLVVDEGPGISGSSLASVALALARAGLARANISLFPGHAQLPRRFGSNEIRAVWSELPRYVAELARVRLAGLPLHEALAAALPVTPGADGEALEIEDLSAGRWRAAALAGAVRGAWPAVCAPFERPKLRFARGGRRVLFVFAGLLPAPGGSNGAGERFAAVLAQRAHAGFAQAPVAVAHGFVALPWLDAVPLSARDLEPKLIERVGRYVAAAAQAPLDAGAQCAAVERLSRMLDVNVGELLGPAAAERAREVVGRAWRELPAQPRAYGDGRLAPYQWLRTLAGRIVKVGGVARDCDHTVVGAQAVLWDLAGARVEWALDRSATRVLVTAYHAAGGEPATAAVLRFYELAYAAFRAAQVALCEQLSPPGDAERDRLSRARTFYTAAIERVLAACSQRAAS